MQLHGNLSQFLVRLFWSHPHRVSGGTTIIIYGVRQVLLVRLQQQPMSAFCTRSSTTSLQHHLHSRWRVDSYGGWIPVAVRRLVHCVVQGRVAVHQPDHDLGARLGP
jgi:hypothetical protein|eukprot:COSAG01_NODE_1556_length_9940_cov_13.610337_8_plen_107_part_00